MKAWLVTYYEANRFGSMQEKAKTFPAHMTSWEVRKVMDGWIEGQQRRGRPVFPQYDVVEEEIAA